MDLVDKKCIPCEGSSEPLNEAQIQTYQSQLKSDWEILNNKKIQKTFPFKDFKQAIAFVNNVADIAEQEQHHPDIHVFYNKVVIALWTHAIGGLSENDFILARKIEQQKMV